MPARKGDGTGLLFNGYSEVRKGDGSILWTAGGDIPDNGLKQRYRASDLGLNDGDTVSTWSDISGNGNDATATGDPTYVETDTGSAVRFDGSDYFTVPSITDDNDLSIFAVIKITDTTKEKYIYSGGYNNADSYLLFHTDAPEYAFITDDGDGFDSGTASTGPSGNVELLDIVRAANNSTRIHLDGSAIFDGETKAISQATHDHHIGWGRPRDRDDAELVADVYEIIKYNDDVTDSERQEIYDYVSSEYGLTIS